MVKNSGRQQHLYQVFGGLGRRERTQQESDYPYEGLLVRTVLSYHWGTWTCGVFPPSPKWQDCLNVPELPKETIRSVLNTCFHLGVWNFGYVLGRGGYITSSQLKPWVCNELPGRCHSSHVITSDAGGIQCVLCDSTGLGLWEAPLAPPLLTVLCHHPRNKS